MFEVDRYLLVQIRGKCLDSLMSFVLNNLKR